MKNRASLLFNRAKDLAAWHHDAANLQPRSRHDGGHTRAKRAGTGFDIWQMKEYHPGDDIRTIDWKQSARSDAVILRQRERETIRRIGLAVDTGPAMDFGPKNQTKRDTAITLAAAMAIAAIDRHDRVTLSGQEKPMAREMDVLGWIETALEPHPVPTPESSSFDHLVLIGDFLRPIGLIDDEWNKVQPAPTSVVQILAPAEIDLPYTGSARFHPPGQDSDIRIDDVPGIRNAYRARLMDHREALKASCAARGWHFHAITTDDDLAILIAAIERDGGISP